MLVDLVANPVDSQSDGYKQQQIEARFDYAIMLQNVDVVKRRSHKFTPFETVTS